MTTRNLVPRADNEGKLGISSKKWSELNATTANLTTLKISSLKLNAVADLDFLTNGAGIKAITTNNDGQFVVALDDTFLTSRIGFNADGTKPDFTLPNGDPLPGNTVIAAGDTLIEAIQKLNDDLRDVSAPSDLTINSFNADSITTSSEAFTDNDITLMTSAAIDDRIQSYGYTTNTGDITSIISGIGLDLDGGDGLSGDVKIKLSNTTVTAGAYGSGTQIPTFTVDAQGRLTAAGTANISTSFSITDENVIDIFNVGEVLTFAGGTGLSTAVTNNKVTTTLSNTTVTAGAYGSATEIPTFTVDAQGRLTAAGTVGITTTLTVDVDGVGTQDVSLADDNLQILGGTGINSSIDKVGNDVTVILDLDNTDVTAAQYGDANSVGQFTVDAQGRLTQAANVDISITSSQVNDATSDNTVNKIVSRDANGDFSAGTITANLTGNASSAGTADQWDQGRTVTFAGGDVTGSFTIDGSADVDNVTLTIGANSVALGNDTTGDYVSSLVAGAGIALANNSGESATPTISVNGILEDLDTLGVPTLDGQFIVATGAGTFAYETGNDARTSLGLGTGDTPTFSGINSTSNIVVDNQSELRLKEANVNGDHYISIKSPAALVNTYNLVLPDTDGNADEVLVTDGDGNLSWTTVEAAAGNAVNSFANVAVSGQDTLEADAAQDTLTIAAGDAISLTTDANQDKLTITVVGVSNEQIDAAAGIVDTKLATISTANKVSLSAINIDGGDDIGADLEDSDLIIVDDGAGGSNRKAAVSRIASYINDHALINTLSNLTTIGSSGNKLTAAGSFEIEQNLTVTGSLTVNGDQFVVDGTTVQLDDNLIELGLVDKLAPTGATTKDLGLMLHRHDGTNASKLAFYWDESDDKFKLESGVTETNGIIGDEGTTSTLVADLEGHVTGTVSDVSNHDTDDITEGSTNLYHTDVRARAAISVTDAGGDGSLSYNNTSGVITYTGPSAAETRSHFSGGTGVTITNGVIDIGQSVSTDANVQFVQVTADLIGDVTGTVSDVSNHNTDDITEGVTNLYHTDVRARSAISVTDAGGDGSLAYDNTSGILTYTGPSAAETRSHFSGGTGVTITDGAVSIGQSVEITDEVIFSTVTADLIGDVTGTVSSLENHNTTNLTEGTNLYYTDTRARSAVSVTDAGGDGSLAYNSGTGVITYTGPSADDTRAHFSGGTGVTITDGAVSIGQDVATNSNVTFNTVTADLIGDVTGTVTDVSNHNTDDIAEGSTNLYHTDARARSAISVTNASGDGLLAYNNGTGVITYTGPSAAETRAHFAAGAGINIINGLVSLDISGIGESNVNVASDSIVILDNDDNSTKRETIADFVTGITSTGLSSLDGQVSLNYDDSTIGINADNKVEVKDNSITLSKLAHFSEASIVVVGAQANSTDPVEITVLDEDTLESDSATSLVTQQSVKAYVDGKLGRHGGIFLTDSVDNNHDDDNYNRDVLFDSSPIVRSHFGPFAFDLQALRDSAFGGDEGSDIIFYGSTSYQSSDRHFEITLNTTVGDATNGLYDTVFTGANENTP